MARLVICVHGVARNGRDFDVVAEQLADTRTVCSPPYAWARRERDRLANPHDYVFTIYLATLTP